MEGLTGCHLPASSPQAEDDAILMQPPPTLQRQNYTECQKRTEQQLRWQLSDLMCWKFNLFDPLKPFRGSDSVICASNTVNRSAFIQAYSQSHHTYFRFSLLIHYSVNFHPFR